MIIFPAIDLLDGKCVRLYKGDYNKCEQVASDPVETAKRFLGEGAEYLHIVDLNGAKDGGSPNFAIIEKLAHLGLKTQTGGGIRNMERVKSSFSAGVDKVIIGSAAVNDRAFLQEALDTFGERIVLGIDADGGYVKTQGWLSDSGLHYIDFASETVRMGAQTIVFTDISRDGTMQGVSLEQTKALQDAVRCNIIASGGVNAYTDIEKLKEMGVYGVILGKSLYAGAVELKKVLEIVK